MITTTAATQGADSARTSTITFRVHKAWWLMPYLRVLAVVCAVTGMEPNMDRVNRLIEKGVTVKAVR